MFTLVINLFIHATRTAAWILAVHKFLLIDLFWQTLKRRLCFSLIYTPLLFLSFSFPSLSPKHSFHKFNDSYFLFVMIVMIIVITMIMVEIKVMTRVGMKIEMKVGIIVEIKIEIKENATRNVFRFPRFLTYYITITLQSQAQSIPSPPPPSCYPIVTFTPNLFSPI